MKILLAGGSGFIGTALKRALHDRGDEVVQLVRREASANEIFLIPTEQQIGPLPEVVAIINLAGHSIGQRRLTDKEKTLILESRIRSTQLLAHAVANSDSKPATFLNASAIGFYGIRDERLDETSIAGQGFLSSVVRSWEAATKPAQDAGVRTVHLRTGIVLGKQGGLLKRL